MTYLEVKGMKRRRKKLMVIIPVTVVCVAGAGTVGYFKLVHTKPVQKEIAATQSAEAKKGNLSKTIVGTGNLELADAQDQNAPSGLEISEVLVESGDEVEEGDVLAVVDESSILEAMEQVQDEISQLDESIQEYQDSDEENTIESSVSGRVKKIYVSSGADVSDTMVSDGALMLLSLDGKMSVSLENVSEVEAGDSVTVTLSSGTQVTGTVDSLAGDTCTVTVTDNGTVYGDTVTVTDSSGNELGSGELNIHQPLAITGTSGTVSSVNVSENASVSEGTTLLTLEGSANETQYQELLAKREARIATLKKLIQLKADPEIKAEISGTVQSVNVSAGSSTASDSSTGSSASGSSSSGSSGNGKAVSQMAYTTSAGRGNTGYTVADTVSLISLSCTDAVENMNTAEDFATQEMAVEVNENVDFPTEEENSAEPDDNTTDTSDTEPETPADEENPDNSDNEDDSSEAEDTVLQFGILPEGTCSASTVAVPLPVTGETPDISLNAEDGSYTGAVQWNPGDEKFQEKTVYQAVVTLTAGEGCVFRADSITGISVGTVSGVNVSEDGKTMSFQITFPATGAEQNEEKNEDPDEKENTDSAEEIKEEDTTDGITDGSDEKDSSEDKNSANNSGEKDSGSVSDENSGKESGSDSAGDSNGTKESSQQNGNSSQTENTGAASQSMEISGNASSGTASAAALTTASQTEETESTESTSGTELSASEYSTDVALFTISPDDTMTLDVSVDELDINSVETGQEAEVTFDAIEDKEFTGEVTEVGSTASVSGGVAKYTVSISVPKDDEMKQGMNASATITIENRENVITIPVNALQEKGDKVFVYTKEDEEGNLSGETEVTTGLSDGTTVEITEGLSEGDTVYYNKSGNTDSGSGNASGMPDGMGDFGDMSGGPGGSSDSGNSGGPGGNGGGPGGGGNSGGNGGGGTPPNM